MPLLETADSLMLSDPDAARQMLLSVEQGTDLRMNRSERAYYLLLMAEADYLCEKPLFRDTAVREAVRFFRSCRAQYIGNYRIRCIHLCLAGIRFRQTMCRAGGRSPGCCAP